MEFHIREAREKAGYSQKELATMIGVAQNTFHGYESGKHDPKSELLIKIAQACRVSVDFLLGYNAYQDSANKIAPSTTEAVPGDEQEQSVMNLVSELTQDQQEFLLAWLKITIELRRQKPPSPQE